MDVIFKFMILLGVIELGTGIVSTYRGHSIIASLRQPPSVFAGVPELAIAIVLITIGTIATRSWKKR